jgi:enoyl-CoA hydratase/carnithine racemase
MAPFGSFTDIGVDIDGHIAVIELQRPPHNFFDLALIQAVAGALESLDAETDCRAVVLAAAGRSFCAGAQLAGPADASTEPPPPGDRQGRHHLYYEAVRIFETGLPIVAAVQGAAIGGGFGLALAADFRIACPEARFSANFARLGFHHGFGLTVTLPALVGQQQALRMLYTGVRVKGEDALPLGLCDELVPADDLRPRAMEFANEIATSAPLAVRSIRRTMRQGLAARIRLATDHEQVEQDWLRRTEDFREGVQSSAERRDGDFTGR